MSLSGSISIKKVLRSILDSSEHIIVLIDRNYHIQEFNVSAAENAKRFLGTEIHIGDCVLDLLRDKIRERFEQHFSRALTGIRQKGVIQFHDHSGEQRWFEFIYNPVREDNNSVTAINLLAFSIDERKKIRRIDTPK